MGTSDEVQQGAFHQHHAVTVEGVMRYYAEKIGEDPDFWGICGLLHDVVFRAVRRNTAPKPRSFWRKSRRRRKWSTPSAATVTASAATSGRSVKWRISFAADELTGLIGAAIILRPSHSCKDMDVKSVKKKFKDKRFAAGCDREVIQKGAEMLAGN